MTNENLIRWLEQHKILEWQGGDVVKTDSGHEGIFLYIENSTGLSCDDYLRIQINPNKLHTAHSECCTHSPKDTKLLGRALVAVDNEEMFRLYRHEPYTSKYICDFNEETEKIAVDWNTIDGDDVLHVLLLAWKAKVEAKGIKEQVTDEDKQEKQRRLKAAERIKDIWKDLPKEKGDAK